MKPPKLFLLLITFEKSKNSLIAQGFCDELTWTRSFDFVFFTYRFIDIAVFEIKAKSSVNKTKTAVNSALCLHVAALPLSDRMPRLFLSFLFFFRRSTFFCEQERMTIIDQKTGFQTFNLLRI